MSDFDSSELTGQDDAAACPGNLTWSNTIQALFAPYVECMQNFGVDLSKYSGSAGDSVVENIDEIKQRIDDGSMPAGANDQKMWQEANGTFLFNCWYAQTPPYPE